MIVCRRLFACCLILLAGLLGALPAAQAQLAEGGARSLSLGRATVALPGDTWNHHNPAGWSTLDARSVALFASQPFGLSELRIVSLAAAVPTPYGTAAATARTYGFEDYRETTLGLGVARAVPLSRSRRIHLGLHARLHTLAFGGDFGSTSTFTLSAGALVDVLRGVTFGVHARNLLAPRDDGARLEAPLSTEPGLEVGLAYRPIDAATVLLAVDRGVDDFDTSVRGGLEIRPVEVLAVRAGFTTAPARISLGAGVDLSRAHAALAFENHEALGWTPAIDLLVRF
ncbi:MAG: hypothetical protein AAFY55_12690 [Bacteroidota bacterium]